jgi:hypothetical protein
MARALRDRARAVRRREDGIVMVEALVAGALGVVLMLCGFALYEASTHSQAVTQNRSESILTAREGLERMTRELRTALPVAGTSPQLASSQQIVFQTITPGTGSNTTPSTRWIRYDCSSGNACKRTTSASFPPPTTGGNQIVTSLQNTDVFALPQTNYATVKVTVDVPGQNQSVTLEDGVMMRNVP